MLETFVIFTLINIFLKVHSANSWETANLGDESRNQKFLRLMGAKKVSGYFRMIVRMLLD